MPLTNEEVLNIAHLARLNLSEEELALYRDQLSAILEHFERLKLVDTSNISENTGVPEAGLLRDDVPIQGLEFEKVLLNAANIEGRQFKVPPVFGS